MNPSIVKQQESKSVPSKATNEATNVTSTAASKRELEAVVKAPVDTLKSKQQEAKPVPTNVLAENPTSTVSAKEQVLTSNVLDSIIKDPANTVVGSSRYAAAREPNSKLSIVNHINSNRCKINSSVQDELKLTAGDVVQIIVKDKMVLVLKSQNAKGIVMKEHGNLYSKELVNRVTDMFQFDFSEQSTHHLTEVTFQNWNDQLVAILTP